MAFLYLDTSALMKRYKREKGSEVINFLFSLPPNHPIHLITSSFTIIEITSAGERLVRSNGISEFSYKEILLSFVNDAEHVFHFLSMNDTITLSAANGVKYYSLRPGDALQFASFTHVLKGAKAVHQDAIFVVSDLYLYQIAEQQGIRVLNPENTTLSEINRILEL